MAYGNTEVLDSDPEFRRLHTEHRIHEERLSVLAAKSRLSEEEEFEEKRLKKEKLLPHFNPRGARLLFHLCKP